MEGFLFLILGLGVGAAAGFFIKQFQTSQTLKEAESKAKRALEEAHSQAKEILLSAKDEALKIKEEAKKEEQERRREIARLEEKLEKREEELVNKIADLEKKREALILKEEEIEKIKKEIEKQKQDLQKKLEEVSKLPKEKARQLLLEDLEKEMKDELIRKVKEMEQVAKEEADKKAREIISLAIQRYAAPQTSETTVSTVFLPSDDIKGRIIGREGRNIHAFEKATGVDLIVDDTPEAVVISSFDPVRREVARLALEKLIKDGRIQPARIEEVVEEAKKEVALQIKEAGENAAYELGISGLHPDLIKLLGRLRFRTSYSQNVLQHSMEVAYIASMLAAELGADVNVCKKAGLLHDIGKAVDHEVPGNHDEIGREILKKYGLPQEIIHAVEAHHERVPYKSVEAILVQAADAISGSRPGARRESYESYIKRLQELENIANSFEGVEKSFAIQAGREIRVIVQPDQIDDLEATKLANKIARRIEQELKYPGQIKVNVIREVRAIDFAK